MDLSLHEKAVLITKSPRLEDNPNDTDFEFKIINVLTDGKPRNILYSLAKYTPNNKDKLFFYPGCDVPRYKVREWGNKYNISITTDESKATHSIAGKKTVNACLQDIRYFSEDSDVYCSWLRLNFQPSLQINELIALIKQCEYKSVLIDRNSCNNFGMQSFGYGKTYNHSPHTSSTYGFKCFLGDMAHSDWTTYNRLTTVTDEDFARLNNLNNPSYTVYSEQSLIELVNEDSAIIDKTMYNQIRTMFESTNREDKLMALSIMSNCNVKPSLHFLLLLLREFSGQIVSLKEHKHVNFKSLLKYLALPNWDYLNVDDIIQCLMNKDELTMEIITEVADEVKRSMQKDHNTKHFKINTITVSDEVKNHMMDKIKLQQSTQLIGKEE